MNDNQKYLSLKTYLNLLMYIYIFYLFSFYILSLEFDNDKQYILLI